MAKLHSIHEALEDDIVETQSGNAKIIDLMHQIIHVRCSLHHFSVMFATCRLPKSTLVNNSIR